MDTSGKKSLAKWKKGLLWTTLIHALVFIFFWETNLDFHQAVNQFLGDQIGTDLNFVLGFLILALGFGIWSFLCLFILNHPEKASPGWLVISASVFFLLFFYGSFIVLFIKNPIQFPRLIQGMEYFRIFFDVSLLTIFAMIFKQLMKSMKKFNWMKWGAPGLLAVLWLVPFFWLPGNVYRGSIPDKPLLMAHRGASSLAPENTLASMQSAADIGVYGLESDITISRDGVLFLMHDSTLERTTNVGDIFPERRNDPADSFSWGELSRLEAGRGFDGEKPYSGLAIPTLEDLLQIVREKGLRLIFDLRVPSVDNAYSDEALSLCLEEVKDAGVASRTWILAEPDDIRVVKEIVPDAVLSAGLDYRKAPSAEEILASGYKLVNSEYGLTGGQIHAYQDAGLWVNIWTVDEAWQYSRLWLLGVNSVTSNRVQVLISLDNPVLAIPMPVFIPIWLIFGACLLIFLFFPQKRM